MIWNPTMELRFLLTNRLKVLQQKWVKYREFAITAGPGMSVTIEQLETGESEWRTVPLVEETSDESSD